MSGAELTVFRSRDPANLVGWDAYAEQRPAYSKKVQAAARKLCKMIGDGKKRGPMVTRSLNSRFVGLEWNGGEVPVGWRRERNQMVIVPKVSTKEGKAAAQIISEAQPPKDPRLSLKGMPTTHFGAVASGGMAMHTPSMEVFEVDGVRWVYVAWGTYKPPMKGIDKKIWKPVKLSEYFALKEAQEEAEAKA